MTAEVPSAAQHDMSSTASKNGPDVGSCLHEDDLYKGYSADEQPVTAAPCALDAGTRQSPAQHYSDSPEEELLVSGGGREAPELSINESFQNGLGLLSIEESKVAPNILSNDDVKAEGEPSTNSNNVESAQNPSTGLDLAGNSHQSERPPARRSSAAGAQQVPPEKVCDLILDMDAAAAAVSAALTGILAGPLPPARKSEAAASISGRHGGPGPPPPPPPRRSLSQHVHSSAMQSADSRGGGLYNYGQLIRHHPSLQPPPPPPPPRQYFRTLSHSSAPHYSQPAGAAMPSGTGGVRYTTSVASVMAGQAAAAGLAGGRLGTMVPQTHLGLASPGGADLMEPSYTSLTSEPYPPRWRVSISGPLVDLTGDGAGAPRRPMVRWHASSSGLASDLPSYSYGQPQYAHPASVPTTAPYLTAAATAALPPAATTQVAGHQPHALLSPNCYQQPQMQLQPQRPHPLSGPQQQLTHGRLTASRVLALAQPLSLDTTTPMLPPWASSAAAVTMPSPAAGHSTQPGLATFGSTLQLHSQLSQPAVSAVTAPAGFGGGLAAGGAGADLGLHAPPRAGSLPLQLPTPHQGTLHNGDDGGAPLPLLAASAAASGVGPIQQLQSMLPQQLLEQSQPPYPPFPQTELHLQQEQHQHQQFGDLIAAALAASHHQQRQQLVTAMAAIAASRQMQQQEPPSVGGQVTDQPPTSLPVLSEAAAPGARVGDHLLTDSATIASPTSGSSPTALRGTSPAGLSSAGQHGKLFALVQLYENSLAAAAAEAQRGSGAASWHQLHNERELLCRLTGVLAAAEAAAVATAAGGGATALPFDLDSELRFLLVSVQRHVAQWPCLSEPLKWGLLVVAKALSLGLLGAPGFVAEEVPSGMAVASVAAAGERSVAVQQVLYALASVDETFLSTLRATLPSASAGGSEAAAAALRIPDGAAAGTLAGMVPPQPVTEASRGLARWLVEALRVAAASVDPTFRVSDTGTEPPLPAVNTAEWLQQPPARGRGSDGSGGGDDSRRGSSSSVGGATDLTGRESTGGDGGEDGGERDAGCAVQLSSRPDGIEGVAAEGDVAAAEGPSAEDVRSADAARLLSRCSSAPAHRAAAMEGRLLSSLFSSFNNTSGSAAATAAAMARAGGGLHGQLDAAALARHLFDEDPELLGAAAAAAGLGGWHGRGAPDSTGSGGSSSVLASFLESFGAARSSMALSPLMDPSSNSGSVDLSSVFSLSMHPSPRTSPANPLALRSELAAAAGLAGCTEMSIAPTAGVTGAPTSVPAAAAAAALAPAGPGALVQTQGRFRHSDFGTMTTVGGLGSYGMYMDVGGASGSQIGPLDFRQLQQQQQQQQHHHQQRKLGYLQDPRHLGGAGQQSNTALGGITDPASEAALLAGLGPATDMDSLASWDAEAVQAALRILQAAGHLE